VKRRMLPTTAIPRAEAIGIPINIRIKNKINRKIDILLPHLLFK
jgi:hypothetical protein